MPCKSDGSVRLNFSAFNVARRSKVSMPCKSGGSVRPPEATNDADEETSFNALQIGRVSATWRPIAFVEFDEEFQCPANRAGQCDESNAEGTTSEMDAFQCPANRAGQCDRPHRCSDRRTNRFQCPANRAGQCDGTVIGEDAEVTAVSMPFKSGGSVRRLYRYRGSVSYARFNALQIGRVSATKPPTTTLNTVKPVSMPFKSGGSVRLIGEKLGLKCGVSFNALQIGRVSATLQWERDGKDDAFVSMPFKSGGSVRLFALWSYRSLEFRFQCPSNRAGQCDDQMNVINLDGEKRFNALQIGRVSATQMDFGLFRSFVQVSMPFKSGGSVRLFESDDCVCADIEFQCPSNRAGQCDVADGKTVNDLPTFQCPSNRAGQCDCWVCV